MTALTAPSPAPSRYRRLGTASLVTGVATLLAAVIGVAVSAATPGAAALGVAALGLGVVAIIAAASLVLGIVAVSLCRPRTIAIRGLGITVATIVALALIVFPPSLWWE